jgi:hypothetical protein
MIEDMTVHNYMQKTRDDYVLNKCLPHPIPARISTSKTPRSQHSATNPSRQSLPTPIQTATALIKSP